MTKPTFPGDELFDEEENAFPWSSASGLPETPRQSGLKLRTGPG
jgi:hypothetical protein